MALLNDDALETGENVYKIASERSERADFLYLRWKHTILLKSPRGGGGGYSRNMVNGGARL